MKLSEHQEERRKPVLVPYLRDGYVRSDRDSDNRIYAFLLSVSNPSDSDNAVAEADLRLTYISQTGLQMTVKVRSDEELGKFFEGEAELVLSAPARVDAHQTLLGWCFFRVEESLLKESSIERYVVALVDSHGIEATVEPIVVREFDSEVETRSTVDQNTEGT